jgi:protein-disulfide isomerase
MIVYLISCCWFVFPIPVEAAMSIDTQDFENKVLQIIRDNPDVILESVELYQYDKRQKEQEAQQFLLKKIQENPSKAIGRSPVYGSAKPKIVLIEFSDFQCPYCAETRETLEQFVVNHQDRVALVYKHHPIAQIHPEAMPAAFASWAASQQDKFWQYHDFLFDHQEQLGENLYIQAARDLGLNMPKFERDRKSQDAIDSIGKDMQLAARLGISGTPSFVLNGEIFSGAVQRSFLDEKLSKM